MCIFNNLYFLSTFLTACCRLVTEDVISHVCEPQPFKDAYLFFRFTVLLPFPHVSRRYNETTKTPCTLPLILSLSHIISHTHTHPQFTKDVPLPLSFLFISFSRGSSNSCISVWKTWWKAYRFKEVIRQ